MRVGNDQEKITTKDTEIWPSCSIFFGRAVSCVSVYIWAGSVTGGQYPTIKLRGIEAAIKER